MAKDAYIPGEESDDIATIDAWMRDHAITSLRPIFFKHPEDLEGGPVVVVGWMVDAGEAVDMAELLSASFRNEV
jgi:hypothetical protein